MASPIAVEDKGAMIARSESRFLAAPSLADGLGCAMFHVDVKIIHHDQIAVRKRGPSMTIAPDWPWASMFRGERGISEEAVTAQPSQSRGLY
jgi:hypothetical protein